MENKKKSIISCFIPGYVPNRVVAGVFGFISFCTGSVANNKRQEHLDANDEYLRSSEIFSSSRFIENQTMWNKVLFGSHKKSNMAYSGCEIIATYNALTSLGDRSIRMPELINNFEKKAPHLKVALELRLPLPLHS